ncbi:9617_t:CDS:2 [Gigaspora margarita]|uniref:9617_t:CDS:1 n=1 Tax=Gigaspora margarita TaxID=4874 RepID=A0ABM8W6J2_GIGMA|nr:9617_t:CDS:2 [Gigaspora margarita]
MVANIAFSQSEAVWLRWEDVQSMTGSEYLSELQTGEVSSIIDVDDPPGTTSADETPGTTTDELPGATTDEPPGATNGCKLLP